MFRLRNIKNEDKDDIYVSFGAHYTDKNFYTIVTGENGCGKSSLLRKAVNTYIFDNPEKSKECSVVSFSENSPSRVIALCNARYNRFASAITYIQESKIFYPNYYVQNEQNLEVNKSLQSIMLSVLREIININDHHMLDDRRNPSVIQGIRTAFEMIGVQPDVGMTLEFNKYYIQNIRRIYQAERSGQELNGRVYEAFRKDHMYWRKISGIEDAFIDEFFKSYDELHKKTNVVGTIEISLDYAKVGSISTIMPDYLLLISIAAGFITTSKLQVKRNDSLKWVSTHSLSSGQQSMLMNAVLVSIFAKKDALICIDEPENSLHPEWQLNYMSFIGNLCSPILGCHFLIATHSPQIISGIKSDNGCIVSLIKSVNLINSAHIVNDEGLFISNVQELHSVSSFRRKSADRQLVDVFKSPGFSNESIVHRLIMILTKQTKKIALKTEDEQFIDDIYKFIRSGKIDEFDPVRVIHKQIRAFKNKGAHGDNKYY